MLKLRKTLPLDEHLITCYNLADYMDAEDLKDLGREVVDDFTRDRNSRNEWETKMDTALKLTMQVVEKKTFPWENAANVKFPLITIAAIQYQSRAYPALVSGPTPVACKPVFDRPNPKLPPGLKEAAQQDPQAQQQLKQFMQQAQAQLAEWKALDDRAKRISRHMSFQILEEDETWEEHHDKALLIQSIMGCVFKKTYFDPLLGHSLSECINPRDIVVSYYTKSLDHCPRLTHIIHLTANQCYERIERQLFCPFEEGSPETPQPVLLPQQQKVADEREGTSQQPDDSDPPYEMLEQHRNLDLDGDGYAEPYVVTVRYDTKQVMRVVARFTRRDITFSANKKVLRINPVQAFTKYPFIPSPDGGFYDLGFGALLGPLNETIDSAINQLLDAGTLANAGGGFLGRGFRNKKGEWKFRPGEWKTVDTPGDDLRKNIVPLPTPQPNGTLFQLLTLLIEYSESIAGATDILQGKNPGQNTPAETSRAMVEQGMKVFNGIYKRTHRAMTQEFRKLFRLNLIYMTDEGTMYLSGYKSPWAKMMAKDYAAPGVSMTIKPAADPFYMSDAQRYNQAVTMATRSDASPLYNKWEVERYLIEAIKIPDPDRFLPDPSGPFALPPPVNPKVQIEQMKLQGREGEKAQEYKVKLLQLAQGAEKLAAEIKKLEADAVLAMSQAKGIDAGHQIALLDTQIAAKKNHLDGTLEMLKLLHEMSGGGEDDTKQGGPNGVAGASGNAGTSNPLQQAAGAILPPMGGGPLPK